MVKRRKRRQRDLPPALIVVCEGGTEERFVTDLRRRWEIRKRDVFTEVSARQTVKLVQRAKSLRLEMSPPGRSIETWVAFDHDGRDDWQQAIREAGDAGIHLAISNPCFEQWAILLHTDQRRPLHHHEAQRQLRDLHPGYHHEDHPYLDPQLAEGKLGDAKRRARVLNQDAEGLGEPYRNPMTLFSDLLDRLELLR